MSVIKLTRLEIIALINVLKLYPEDRAIRSALRELNRALDTK